MIPITGALERQVDALQRSQEYWREGPRSTAPPFTIALTREAGTPGTSVAREVAARLNWLVYDHELLEKIAAEQGLRVQLLESVDERCKGWLLESFEALAQAPSVNESSYVRHLIETILSLAMHGRCVIVGRGAAQLLPAESTLRVRLVGAREDRITATSQRLNVSRQEAARWVEETERQRRQFVQEHFRRDPTDPRNYDLLLNTSRWSIAECADQIVGALKCLETRAVHSPPKPVGA